MNNELLKAQETILRVATQIEDPVLQATLLSAAKNLNDPNSRAEIDGVRTVLATDVQNTRLVAVIGASLIKADQAHLDQNRYSRKSSSAKGQESPSI